MTHVPIARLTHLDDLWFQVAGTRCNLTCHHCFISCSPTNRSFDFLTLDQVRAYLIESTELGVNQYYFTGGEPFLNPDMVPILVETLQYGAATVLTNATVFKDIWLTELAAAATAADYSLEFRVSIDGFSAETNDPIRGEGTFDRAMRGVQLLVAAGFLPIITATRTWPEADDLEVLGRFNDALKQYGCTRPRLKLLPTLKIGAEAERTGGYEDSERLDQQMMAGFDYSQLVCDHSRIVTDRGVHVCPILIESPDSLLGSTLSEARRPFPMQHGACFTCFQYGSICSNASASNRGTTN